MMQFYFQENNQDREGTEHSSSFVYYFARFHLRLGKVLLGTQKIVTLVLFSLCAFVRTFPC